MKFKHYKGGEYQLVTLAKDEATQEILVIYRAIVDGTIWSRPASEFLKAGNWNEGDEWTPRFQILLPEGQQLCCDSGCDNIAAPRVGLFEFSRTEDSEGNLIESKTLPVWQCRCGEELRIYHADGSITDFDEPAPADLPRTAIDQLWQAAGLSTYHPDGDQLEKFHAFSHGIAAETLARRTA